MANWFDDTYEDETLSPQAALPAATVSPVRSQRRNPLSLADMYDQSLDTEAAPQYLQSDPLTAAPPAPVGLAQAPTMGLSTLATQPFAQTQPPRVISWEQARKDAEAYEASKPKPEQPIFGLGDVASAAGGFISALPTTGTEAYYRMKEYVSGKRPDQFSPEAQAAFEESRALQERMAQEQAAREKAGTSTTIGQAIREATSSSGYTLGSMLPALAGGVAGAKGGAALGGVLAGPPGAAIGGVLGGIAGGFAGSGAAAYTMSQNQFMEDAFREAEARMQQKQKRSLNEQEKQALYQEMEPVARDNALWEAGPEAVGNAFMLVGGGIAAGLLGKQGISKLAAGAMRKGMIRAGAGAAGAGMEFATETATELGQALPRARMEAYLEGKPMEDAVSRYAGKPLGGAGAAFEEIWRPTLGTLLMFGLGGSAVKGVSKANERFRQNPQEAEAIVEMTNDPNVLAAMPQQSLENLQELSGFLRDQWFAGTERQQNMSEAIAKIGAELQQRTTEDATTKRIRQETLGDLWTRMAPQEQSKVLEFFGATSPGLTGWTTKEGTPTGQIDARGLNRLANALGVNGQRFRARVEQTIQRQREFDEAEGQAAPAGPIIDDFGALPNAGPLPPVSQGVKDAVEQRAILKRTIARLQQEQQQKAVEAQRQAKLAQEAQTRAEQTKRLEASRLAGEEARRLAEAQAQVQSIMGGLLSRDVSGPPLPAAGKPPKETLSPLQMAMTNAGKNLNVRFPESPAGPETDEQTLSRLLGTQYAPSLPVPPSVEESVPTPTRGGMSGALTVIQQRRRLEREQAEQARIAEERRLAEQSMREMGFGEMPPPNQPLPNLPIAPDLANRLYYEELQDRQGRITDAERFWMRDYKKQQDVARINRMAASQDTGFTPETSQALLDMQRNQARGWPAPFQPKPTVKIADTEQQTVEDGTLGIIEALRQQVEAIRSTAQAKPVAPAPTPPTTPAVETPPVQPTAPAPIAEAPAPIPTVQGEINAQETSARIGPTIQELGKQIEPAGSQGPSGPSGVNRTQEVRGQEVQQPIGQGPEGELTNAQQIPAAGAPNGSGGPRPEIRQEGGRPTESGEGVRGRRPEIGAAKESYAQSEVAQGEVAPAPTYEYGLRTRPYGPGTNVPTDFTALDNEFKDANRRIHYGKVTYNRQLTDEEIAAAELVPLSTVSPTPPESRDAQERQAKTEALLTPGQPPASTGAAATPSKPGKKVTRLSTDEIEKYFSPGRIVPSYGNGRDKVVSFNRTKDGWYATVYAVDAEGNRLPVPDGRDRSHSTMPSVRDYEQVVGEKATGKPLKAQPKSAVAPSTPAPASPEAEFDQFAAATDEERQATQRMEMLTAPAFLEDMIYYRDRIGWAVKGERILADGKFIGSQSYVPYPDNPWWAESKDLRQAKKLSDAKVRAALTKFNRGESPENAGETALLDFLIDHYQQRQSLADESAWLEDQLTAEETYLLNRLTTELENHPAFGSDRLSEFIETASKKYPSLTPAQFGRALILAYEDKLDALRKAQPAGRTERAAEGTPKPADEGAGAPVSETPLLTSYTLEELDAENASVQAEIEKQRQSEVAAEAKRQADKDVGGFTLSGSNQPADIAAAAGQGDLLAGAKKAPKAETPDPEKQPVQEKSPTAKPVQTEAIPLELLQEIYQKMTEGGNILQGKGVNRLSGKDQATNRVALLKKLQPYLKAHAELGTIKTFTQANSGLGNVGKALMHIAGIEGDYVYKNDELLKWFQEKANPKTAVAEEVEKAPKEEKAPVPSPQPEAQKPKEPEVAPAPKAEEAPKPETEVKPEPTPQEQLEFAEPPPHGKNDAKRFKDLSIGTRFAHVITSQGWVEYEKTGETQETVVAIHGTVKPSKDGTTVKVGDVFDEVGEKAQSFVVTIPDSVPPAQSDADQRRYSRAPAADTLTEVNLTQAQARAEAVEALGETNVRHLERNGFAVWLEPKPGARPLPGNNRVYLASTGQEIVAPADAQAFVQNGVMHLIPSNMRTGALNAALHESAHLMKDERFAEGDRTILRMSHAVLNLAGLRNFIGNPGFQDLAEQVQRMAREGNSVALKAIAQAQQVDQNRIAEESVAYLVEYGDPKLPIVRRILAVIRAALYRMGVKMELRPEDVRQLAISALKARASRNKIEQQKLVRLAELELLYEEKYGPLALGELRVEALRNIQEDTTLEQFRDLVTRMLERRYSAPPSAKEALRLLRESRFVSDRAALELLGEFPEYLYEAGKFIAEQRQKLVEGRLTPREVAKAYLITQSSIGSDARSLAILEPYFAKVGMKTADVNPLFLNERGGLRPEELMSWWLGTPKGQQALDALEQGRIDRDAFEEFQTIRTPYGRDTLKNNSVLGVNKASGFQWGAVPAERNAFNLGNLAALTGAINATQGDIKSLENVLKRTKGIKESKAGFIGHLLGIGSRITADAVEINFWLTGSGNARLNRLPEKTADVLSGIRRYQKDPRLGKELFKRISQRMIELSNQLADQYQLPRGVMPHLLHHWLWDKAKGIETTHAGLYEAMRRYSVAPAIEVGEATMEEFEAVRAQFQARQAETPFRQWFGKGTPGVTATADGMPITLYHGTNNPLFTEWDSSRAAEASGHPTSGLGFFMTADKGAAARYGNNLLELHAKIDKPYYLTDADLTGIETRQDAERLRWNLMKQGYDGAVVEAPGAPHANYVIAFKPNQIKFTTTEKPTASPDMRYSRQPVVASDAEYLAAVERGDMETAQRMVDEVAKMAGKWAGGMSPIVYHGSPHTPFNQFAIPSKGFNSTVFGSYEVSRNAAFFTPDQNAAAGYMTQGGKTSGSTRRFRVFGEMLDWRKGISEAQFNSLESKGVNQRWLAQHGASWELFDREQDPDGVLVQAIKEMGYDGVIISDTDGTRDFDSYIAFSPSQIKSADPVTRDDAGNVIPLSQRFDATTSDIRYSRQNTGQPPTPDDAQNFLNDIGAMNLEPQPNIIKRIWRNPSLWRKELVQFFTDAAGNTRPAWTRLLSRQQIVEMLQESPIAALSKLFEDTARLLDAEKQDGKHKPFDIAKRWREAAAKSRDKGRNFAKLLFFTTLEHVDPSQPLPDRDTFKDDRAYLDAKQSHARATQMLNDLRRTNPVMADLYKEVMDENKRSFGAYHEALQNRLSRGANGIFNAMMDRAKDVTPTGTPKTLTQRLANLANADSAAYDAFVDAVRQRLANIKMEDADAQAIRDTLPDAEQKALLDDIVTDVQGKIKDSMDSLRFIYEQAKILEPYFPLSRWGDYQVYAEKAGEPKPIFSSFTRQQDQRAAIAQLQKEGWTVKVGYDIKEALTANPPADSFLGKMFVTVDEIVSTKKEAAALKDEFYQMYLRSLPELSSRKHFLHRKGIPGFSMDALRGFAQLANSRANSIARLNHSDTLSESLVEMERTLRRAGRDPNQAEAINRAGALLGELQGSYEWMMNPTNATWANRLTSFGFLWHLTNPSTALINLTQLPIATFPALAAQFKAPGRAFSALNKAIKDYGGWKFHGKVAKEDARKRLFAEYDGDLGLMMESPLISSQISRTEAVALAGMSDDAPEFAGGVQGAAAELYRGALYYGGWLYQKAEVANREITVIAAYRMAREEAAAKGLTREQAHDYASEIAYNIMTRTQGDFSLANRPWFMRGNAMRVMFLFRSFAHLMTWNILRDAYQWKKGQTAESRQIARDRLLWTGASSLVFAGATGFPAYTIIAAIANAFWGSDPDDPWDFDTAVRNELQAYGGETFMRTVMSGPVGQAPRMLNLMGLDVRGVDISPRLSLDLARLWFRRQPDDLEGGAAMDWWMAQVAGPLYGTARGLAEGMRYLGQTSYDPQAWFRSIEGFTPAPIRNLAKSVRFKTEGVTSRQGDLLMDDFTYTDMLAQAIGFTPDELQDQYRTNTYAWELKKAIDKRRKNIYSLYIFATERGDTEMQKEAIGRVSRWNELNPEYPITYDNLRASYQKFIRARAEQEGGVFIPSQGLRARVFRDLTSDDE